MASRFKRIFAIIGVVLAPIVLYIYWKYDPSEVSAFPNCPIKALTGYDCAGCGSQRAIHHLLHLRFAEAFQKNGLLVIALPYLITGLMLEELKGKSKAIEWARFHIFGNHAIWISMTIIGLFWIGRNVV